MPIEGKGIDDESFNPRDPNQVDALFRAGDAMKKIHKRTEKLALPIIQKLTSGQINREEAFSQLQQIFLKHFSSTTPIAESLPQITTSRGDEFRGNLARLLLKNGISVADTEILPKKLLGSEDTRDKVEEIVDPDPDSSD